MKLLICSDTHDRLDHIEAMVARSGEADLLLHCGDIVSPFTLKHLAAHFDGPVHLVWGNNDGDRWRLAQVAATLPQVTLHGEFAELEVEGFRIAMVHFPALARPLFESGRYDLVCCGHNHQAAIERREGRLLVNPGTLYGTLWPATYAVLETETRSVALERLL